jgi:hypothetical protein
MITFSDYCKRKFPSNWEITDKGEGLFLFRDNLVVRGSGFLVVVQEETNAYVVTLEFESFAKELSDYAEKSLSESNNPLRRLFHLNSNLEVVIQKQYIELNLNPKSIKFDNWNFKLIYKKVNVNKDIDNFSDILISFILYIFPYKVEAEEEGAAKSQLLTKYERSHLNRSLCLAYYGYSCNACGIDLKDRYGDIARDFIHVHHLNPISETGVIIPDPILDFVPLCPNCHAIAHLRNPPITIEEIKEMLNENGNNYPKQA